MPDIFSEIDDDICEPPECWPVQEKSGWKPGDDVVVDDVVQVPPAQSGWPAAVPARIENWNFELEPAEYMIHSGDTLAGLAYTYLGSPNRWNELWEMQPQSYRWNHSPNDLTPGQMWPMPAEAADRARKIAPTPPGGVVDKPGPTSNLPLVAGLAAAALVFYSVS